MAEFRVTTAADIVDPDDGLLSLREAVDLANASDDADRIGFDIDASLVLTQGQLIISNDVVIDGEDQPVTFSRVFSDIFDIVGVGTDVVIDGLTIDQNWSGRQGTFFINEDATLEILNSAIVGTYEIVMINHGLTSITNSTIAMSTSEVTISSPTLEI